MYQEGVVHLDWDEALGKQGHLRTIDAALVVAPIMVLEVVALCLERTMMMMCPVQGQL